VNASGLHQLLGAYLLGGLEPAEAAAFDQHLAVCADCRLELDDVASIPALLDAVPVSDAVALTAAADGCLALGVAAGPPAVKPDASYSVAASSGLQFTVGLVKKTWGTELAVDGRSLPVDGTLSLWVKDRDGGEDRACAWTATPTGRVRITGATPVQLARIASVEMRDQRQQTVAVIAVPQG